MARLTSLHAQTPVTPATHPDTSKPGPLFSGRDAFIGAVFVGTTVAMLPLDKRLARHLTNTGAQENRFYRDAAHGLEVFTSPGAYYIGGSMYLLGRVGRFERLADLGWHGTEAVLVADGITLLLKGLSGRSRPFVSSDTSPGDFKLARGFSSGDRQSFPSGHSTTAFAAASAVTAETARWWPKSVWVVAPAMYGGATLVGLSRMYHNKHWASDVVLGAAIGTFSGRKVVQYSHVHKTAIDRVILHTTIAPTGGGDVVVAWNWSVP